MLNTTVCLCLHTIFFGYIPSTSLCGAWTCMVVLFQPQHECFGLNRNDLISPILTWLAVSFTLQWRLLAVKGGNKKKKPNCDSQAPSQVPELNPKSNPESVQGRPKSSLKSTQTQVSRLILSQYRQVSSLVNSNTAKS